MSEREENTCDLTRRHTWDEYYEELKVFRSKHGHDRPKGASRLGYWAREQRKMRVGGDATVNADDTEIQRRIKLLDGIGFDWETNTEKLEQRWQSMFGLLKAYRKEYFLQRELPGINESYRGEELGHWVSTQQGLHRDGKLKEHRQKQLEDIEFPWCRDERMLWKGTRSLGKLDDDWNERFSVLCKYRAKYGDTLVPIHRMAKLESGEDFCLGAYVVHQRYLYRNGLLRKERQEKLESIKFVFKIDYYDAEASQTQKDWDNSFAKLVEYKQERGHCDIPGTDESNRQLNRLGLWARHQRALYQREDLEASRFRRLDDLGFTWYPHQERWNEMVGHLRTYQAQHGDCLVPDAYQTPGGVKLGHWVRTVRSVRRGTRGSTELSHERIAELDELGFEWENVLHKHWDTMYDALVRYQQKHGDCRVPNSYTKDPEDEEDLPTTLGHWVNSQRCSLETKLNSTGDPMYTQRKKRLEDIGFEFSLAHIPHENWETMLEALKAYKTKHGDCRVPNNFRGDSSLPRALGGWVSDQRAKLPARVASGHQVSIDRHKKLDDIGFDWDADYSHDRWMAMYNRLVKYHSEHGNCRVPDAYDENGEGLSTTLGSWVRVQKKKSFRRLTMATQCI